MKRKYIVINIYLIKHFTVKINKKNFNNVVCRILIKKKNEKYGSSNISPPYFLIQNISKYSNN